MAATVLKRRAGLGDHRVLIVDFRSSSVTGDRHPRIVSPAAMLMNSGNKRHRDNYNKVLGELCDRHRMHDKLFCIHNNDKENFVRQINRWGEELEQYMKAAEKKAAKKRNVNNVLDWSSYVGLRLKRKTILSWMKQWMSSRQVNEVHLWRACARHRLGSPDDFDMAGVEAEIEATVMKLDELSKIAPMLRKRFLFELRVKAERWGDTEKA